MSEASFKSAQAEGLKDALTKTFTILEVNEVLRLK